MGYRIDYGQLSERKYPQASRSRRLAGLISAALGVFLLLTGLFWPQGRELLKEFLIPGDSTVTAAAFSQLLTDLRTGMDSGDAVAAFCREILENGQAAH